MRIEECKVYLENPSDKKAPEKQFVFDSAYDGNSSNETIYGDICYSLVESVLEGYNSTIFAYGQTGCGKSHTMQGPTLSKLVDGQEVDTQSLQATKNNGIISNSFDHLFEAISVQTDVRYLVVVSYLEIYNENIRDLLNNDTQNNLKLKENPTEGVFVESLSRHPVHNVTECEQLLLYGTKNRKTGVTLMNSGSSRSHSIFIINVEQISKSPNEHGETDDCMIRKGKLNLVDLAGSERANKTGASGETMKEATKINLSLSALGNVISALVDGKTKHVPYRDSKLTRLLQDSLGGNTKTLVRISTRFGSNVLTLRVYRWLHVYHPLIITMKKLCPRYATHRGLRTSQTNQRSTKTRKTQCSASTKVRSTCCERCLKSLAEVLEKVLNIRLTFKNKSNKKRGRLRKNLKKKQKICAKNTNNRRGRRRN